MRYLIIHVFLRSFRLQPSMSMQHIPSDARSPGRIAAWSSRRAVCTPATAPRAACGELRFRSENGKGLGNFLHARFLEVPGREHRPPCAVT